MTSRTPAVRVSWSEVLARRLERHALANPSRDTRPADIAASLCGVHAQVLSAAELSIGIRIAGITRADVRAALWTERSLVKTRGPRGTVHLLATEDLPMWTGALSALPPARSPFSEDVRLTSEQTARVLEAIADALADADLTVDELTEAIVDRAGPWAGEPVMEAFQVLWPRWRQIEDVAANRGVLCFGPNRGRKVTYTSPQRWLPGFQPADGQTALAELLKRYLHTYGPATPADFAHWLNVPRPWAMALFDSLGGKLEPVEVEGTAAWVAAGDTAAPPASPDGLHLLPYFDAYSYFGHPRELLYPGPAAKRVNGNFQVLVVDGVAAGVWHQRRAGRRLAITVEPLVPLSKKQLRQLDERVARIGAFLEAEAELTIGSVTVGGHA